MTARRKNPFLATRPLKRPYAIYTCPGWEWRVLKTYQHPDKEDANKHARWFVAVRSPMTYGSWEYGDMYCRDVKYCATCVQPFPEY